MQLEELINAGYANLSVIESRYAQYLIDPWAVEPQWRDLFDRLQQEYPIDGEAPSSRIRRLIEAYRFHGHLMARINPLRTTPPPMVPLLELHELGFETADLKRVFPTLEWLPVKTAPLQDLISVIQDVYCGSVGIEVAHLENVEIEEWLYHKIEPQGLKTSLTKEGQRKLLSELNRSGLLEAFLHMKYVGQKRFSLEGAETFIPIVRALFEKSSALGVEQVFMGMAHRGRLNLLANILGKPYAEIFAEFEEDYLPSPSEGSGDVKYHKGYASVFTTEQGKSLQVVLSPNPSHLESVYPVVEGVCRAAQACGHTALPFLVHGDGSLSGQGVVYETLQMSQLRGYSTKGTIHLVINNQIGFTTSPQDARSTPYCTDIAKAFGAPIFHVNAEDPEACVSVANLAVELRQTFGCDVFIDLVCYRKYGHNESDEPAFTQPRQYQIIREKRAVREIYRDQLIEKGVVNSEEAERDEQEFKDFLQKTLETVHRKEMSKQPSSEKKEASGVIVSATLPDLMVLAERSCTVPPGFAIHKKLERLLQERKEMAQGQRPIDWGMAETLAYASLLASGTSIRLTGQDSCRGTFGHRQALWVDQSHEEEYIPLNHLRSSQGAFELFNSPLSEFASLAFESGYAIGRPDCLVIWEAQFGDFCNGAQVVIDQYLASAEMKWGQKCGMVLLLPHGYEGQGPEHSSARMERFLALCAQGNLVVANPSTPAQLFHLLRRQVLQYMQKPLVVFTPKGLLRHPQCVSTMEQLMEGSFADVLDDQEPAERPSSLVFCSGRIFYDLIEERKRRGRADMRIVRIEQLYPFPAEEVKALLKKNSGIQRYLWVQEESQNMGAWSYIQPLLAALIGSAVRFEYVGRAASASPAAGSHALHEAEHKQMMKSLFEVTP